MGTRHSEVENDEIDTKSNNMDGGYDEENMDEAWGDADWSENANEGCEEEYDEDEWKQDEFGVWTQEGGFKKEEAKNNVVYFEDSEISSLEGEDYDESSASGAYTDGKDQAKASEFGLSDVDEVISNKSTHSTGEGDELSEKSEERRGDNTEKSEEQDEDSAPGAASEQETEKAASEKSEGEGDPSDRDSSEGSGDEDGDDEEDDKEPDPAPEGSGGSSEEEEEEEEASEQVEVIQNLPGFMEGIEDSHITFQYMGLDRRMILVGVMWRY